MRAVLATILVLTAPIPAIGQDSTAAAPAANATEEVYRDPQKARLLATILPGAGYVYTGEYFRGYGTWVVTATSFIVTPFLFDYGACMLTPIDKCDSAESKFESHLWGILAAGTGLWTWISSVRDAPKSAERANERHRRRELRAHPVLSPGSQTTQWRAGVRLDW
ncbi:MAG TPA: hypothetical protein VJ840_10290 [Gemmatimonadaceae bacterium]|nr:hypothetical protein [Gemmatimonadaceae bacterium]